MIQENQSYTSAPTFISRNLIIQAYLVWLVSNGKHRPGTTSEIPAVTATVSGHRPGFCQRE